MDIKTLNISRFAIFWKALWGGKAAVFDYLLDKANTAAAMLPKATADKLNDIYHKVIAIRDAMYHLEWIVPASWRPSYISVVRCLSAIIDTLADGKMEASELEKVVTEFRLAYATWRADDVPASEVEGAS